MADQVGWPPDLEAELRSLGREIDVPAAPDLTADVRRRLERPEVRRRRPYVRWRIAVPVALALLGLLLATPKGRAAITEVLRFTGIELRQEPAPPLPSPRESASLPGEQRMSLEQARRRAAFPILVPVALGEPDAVAVSDGGRVVSLIYRGTPYGEVRLDEFDGHLSPIYFQKFIQMKIATQVDVAGRKGLWIAGPHEIIYVRRDGIEDMASARLTKGNTLIWDTGRVALRLEGNLREAQALAVARSALPPG